MIPTAIAAAAAISAIVGFTDTNASILYSPRLSIYPCFIIGSLSFVSL